MKKASEAAARFLNGLADILLLSMAAAVLLVSLYSLADNYLVLRGASDPSLIAYKPETVSEAEDGFLPGQAAWLCVEDTCIDFPVMQSDNNFDYLNTDPYGEYSMSGSIFMDWRNAGDLSDEYTMIYGHHMDHYRMFGSLDLFASEDYFMGHRKGFIAVKGKTWGLELFAVAWGMGNDHTVFNPRGRTAAEVYDYIEENAVINTGYVPGRRIVALSTCAGESYLSRLIVFGMLTE